MKKCLLNIIACVCFILPAAAQTASMPANDNALSQKYPFVRSVFNRILNTGGLDSFYKKLYQLKTTGTGTISVVHIGDSHIQADFLSDVVRDGLQDFFGDAGRGLVFPYQLAQSNAPDDISSSSNTFWQFNRIAHPEIDISYGVSGYGIRSTNSGADINLSLRPSVSNSSFTRLKFFLDTSSSNSWILHAGITETPYLLKKEQGDSLAYQQVNLDQPATNFSISSLPSGNTKEFYGVSLENSNAGVIYHTIGVNGARYEQYNIASLFWEQLPALKADLYIVSLGTNEAQMAGFVDPVFTKELDIFMQKLKQTSPGASVLITTAPDSYKGRRFNTVLRDVNASLTNYCNKNYIPLWDLYRITNGYGSANSWARRGLMSRDRVHFTSEGYRLQGNLLLMALAKGYNTYTSSY
ncbi:MAG: GDSL-type esterase/lipase family protein [Chitinophagaceae bacterium]